MTKRATLTSKASNSNPIRVGDYPTSTKKSQNHQESPRVCKGRTPRTTTRELLREV